MMTLRKTGPKEYVGPNGETIRDTYSASGPTLGRYPTKTRGRWLVKHATGRLERFDRLRDVRSALTPNAGVTSLPHTKGD